MGNAIKSVTSGLCACVLTSSLVVVPPDHGARPESQAVQLAAFTFPSTASLAANLEEYLRDAAQTRALVAPVTPGGGPDVVAPPTFKSGTDPAISTQQVIDAAPALALLDPGVYAGPLAKFQDELTNASMRVVPAVVTAQETNDEG